MGNLLRHGVHDGLRGHDGACNCSFGVDGLAGRIRMICRKSLICAGGGGHRFRVGMPKANAIQTFLKQILSLPHRLDRIERHA